MSYTKMLGLAAITALAAMAFVGATSASATNSTALCLEKSVELVCPEDKRASTVHFVAKDPVILTPFANILCLEALLSGNVEGATRLGTAPNPLGILITALTYSHCLTVPDSINCNVTAVNLGLVDLLKTALDLGTWVGLPHPTNYTEISLVCSPVINCTYKWEGLTGHALSATLPTDPAGHAGQIRYENASLTKSKGILCPKEAKLHAVFESLQDLFIRS